MKDGHIHSHYCPHGTNDSFEMYIENAIKNGYDEISCTIKNIFREVIFVKDGHIHSHYCPHGTNDSFEMYIENAIKNGYDEISCTEHFPIPDGFVDRSPDQDSTPSVEAFERYLDEAE